MAFEQRVTQPFSLPAASTGLKAKRFVTVDANGRLAYPALGAPIVGASVTGSTGSTRDYQAMTVLGVGNVVRVEAVGSSLSKGDLVQASSIGRAKNCTGGSYAVGVVVDGSSGSTGRVLSVLLTNIGTT